MGNKLSRNKSVDSKFTKPTGLYPTCEWDEKTVKKLINKKKVAPRYPGREEPGPDLDECPICFLWYPGGLNRSKCCKKPICTECFLQFKKPTAQKAIQCPFCNSLNYSVKYTGQMTKEEREVLEAEEQKVIEAKIRARKAELSRQIEREKEVALEREQKKQEAAAAGQNQPPPPPENQDSNPSSQVAREQESESRRWHPGTSSEGDGNDEEDHDRANTDIEELMVMEAIRLSLLDLKKGDLTDPGAPNASDDDSNTYEHAQSILAAGMDASSSDEDDMLAGPRQRLESYDDDDSYAGGSGGYHSDRTLEQRVIARRLHSDRKAAVAESGLGSSQDDLALESRWRYRSYGEHPHQTQARAHGHSHMHSEFEEQINDDLDDVEAKQEIANLLEMNLEWFVEDSTLRRCCPWEYDERSAADSEEADYSPNVLPSMDRMNPSMSPLALEPSSTLSPPSFGASHAENNHLERLIESDSNQNSSVPDQEDSDDRSPEVAGLDVPSSIRAVPMEASMQENETSTDEESSRENIQEQTASNLEHSSANSESGSLPEGSQQGDQETHAGLQRDAELSSNMDTVNQEPCPSPQLTAIHSSEEPGMDEAGQVASPGGKKALPSGDEQSQYSEHSEQPMPPSDSQVADSSPGISNEAPGSAHIVDEAGQEVRDRAANSGEQEEREVGQSDEEEASSEDSVGDDCEVSQGIEVNDQKEEDTIEEDEEDEEEREGHDEGDGVEVDLSSKQGEESKSNGDDALERLSNGNKMSPNSADEQLHGEEDDTSSKKVVAFPAEELGSEELR